MGVNRAKRRWNKKESDAFRLDVVGDAPRRTKSPLWHARHVRVFQHGFYRGTCSAVAALMHRYSSIYCGGHL